MTHWHVTRHSEDDDPYVTDDLYDAMEYAATELDLIADHEHDMITVSGEAGDFEEAYKSFKKTEILAGLQANATNIYTQSRSVPADRTPLYQEDMPYNPPLTDEGTPTAESTVNTASELYQTALRMAENINRDSQFSIWSCDAETAYVTDTGDPSDEDDPNAHMTCVTYL
jgi:hypothetical protein